jgi:hypothetical protein
LKTTDFTRNGDFYHADTDTIALTDYTQKKRKKKKAGIWAVSQKYI